jgi:hypothetical protein
MLISFYRESTDIENSVIYKFFKKLQRSNPDLWSLTWRTLKDAEKSSNLQNFRKDWVERLPNVAVPLFEFRIPPQRRGGVVRLYFGYKKSSLNSIEILTAELKHKTKANQDTIDQAIKRYKEVCI